MKTPSKILWTEGVTLRPQHFQQQDRYHDVRLQRMTAALHPYAWGVRVASVWNDDALANNILQAESLSLVFQDGDTYDAPGSLSIAPAPALAHQLDRLMQKLLAKIDALYASQREPSKDVVVQGGDAASLALLQTISAGCAALHHHARCPGFHPERLFQDLLALAGGLMAFSRKVRIADLPGYDHKQPGRAFAALDAVLRDLVDMVIVSNTVAIALVQDAARPSYFEGKLPPDVVDQKTLLCLAVRADLPALELVAAVPARFKIGAPEDVGRLVASALPGVELAHMPQVPAALPVRPNTYYFALQGKGPLHAAILQAQAVSVYVPSGIRELALALFAIRP